MDSHLSKILLDRYHDGDSAAAFEIYSRYAQRMFALTRTRIGNQLTGKIDPEDITQSAFQAFFAKADRNEVFWRQQGDLWRLLAAICINHVKREDEFFGAAKRNVVKEQAIESEIGDRLHGTEVKLAELLGSLLHNEKPLVSQVARARLAGFTLTEIAVETGRSERTVRRVLQILKAKLATESTLNLESHPHEGKERGEKNQNVPRFDADYNDFELLKMIDAGAFGKVYLALDKNSDTLVAVKALRRDWIGDTAAESLFLNEAKLLSRITHPNVVQFIDAGPLPNGSWFIVMELASGVTFDRAIQSRVETINVLNWLHQICQTLEFLHREGIVHGDLKPTNITVSNDNVQLIDFGFSQQAKTTREKSKGGTSGFMPPDRHLTPASDMFAFGKVVEFAITEYANSLPNSTIAIELNEIVKLTTCRDQDERAVASETCLRIAAMIENAKDAKKDPESSRCPTEKAR